MLGVYLSHTLNLPLIVGFFGADRLPPRTLVVDDNVITGASLEPYHRAGFATAVLVTMPIADGRSTFAAQVSTEWPIFPWEADACVTVPLSAVVGIAR